MEYIKEDVEKMLKEHKENEGRLFEVDLKIDEIKERLEYAGTVNEETKEEAIEGMQLSGHGYDNIPAKTNKTTDKTYNTAINYKKEQRHINREDRDFLERKLEELKLEKKELDKKIARVNNWLDKVEEREAFVLRELYINNKGKNWKRVIEEYKNEYGRELTDRQLRTTRDKAIQAILKIVNV